MHTRSTLALACALSLTTLFGCSSDGDDPANTGSGDTADGGPGDVVIDMPSGTTDVDTDTGIGTGTSAPDGTPFIEPDASGTSVVSRLGYREALARADALVSADYLDLLFDVEADLVASLERDDSFGTEIQDESVDCADGGTAVLTSGASRFDPIDIVFTDCAFEGRTLTGAYTRTFGPSVFGSGFAGTVDAVLDDLFVDAGDAGSMRATGTVTRVDGEAGFCPDLPQDFHDYRGTVTSAVVVDDAGDTFTVGDARFAEKLERRELDADTSQSGELGCTGTVDTLSFDSAATVQGVAFGTGSAALARSGGIVRDARDDGEASATASTSATFGDGSSVAATLTDDATGAAQIDLTADGISTSFDDLYYFVAR